MRRVTRTFIALLLSVGFMSGCGSTMLAVDVLPVADTSDTVGPYVVTAVVRESELVTQARVLWYVGDGAAPAPLPLVRSGETDRFQALIPGQPVGSVVRWRVEVETTDHELVRLPAPQEGDETPLWTFRVTPAA